MCEIRVSAKEGSGGLCEFGGLIRLSTSTDIDRPRRTLVKLQCALASDWKCSEVEIEWNFLFATQKDFKLFAISVVGIIIDSKT